LIKKTFADNNIIFSIERLTYCLSILNEKYVCGNNLSYYFEKIKHLLICNGIEYLPYSNPIKLTHKNDFTLNIFTGFTAWYTMRSNYTSELNFVLNYIKEILCKNNEINYEFFIGWLAHIIQKPEVQTGIWILMKCSEGTCEDIFWKWFCNNIIGRRNSLPNTTINKLSQKFDFSRKNKLLIICNEVNSCNISKSKDEFNLIVNDQHIKYKRHTIYYNN